MTAVLLQANIRPELASRVVRALIDAGCGDILQTDAQRVHAGLDASQYEFSMRLGQAFEPMVRLEAVGSPGQCAQWVHVIQRTGGTGRLGDGFVTLIPVVRTEHLSEPGAAP